MSCWFVRSFGSFLNNSSFYIIYFWFKNIPKKKKTKVLRFYCRWFMHQKSKVFFSMLFKNKLSLLYRLIICGHFPIRIFLLFVQRHTNTWIYLHSKSLCTDYICRFQNSISKPSWVRMRWKKKDRERNAFKWHLLKRCCRSKEKFIFKVRFFFSLLYWYDFEESLFKQPSMTKKKVIQMHIL